MTTTLAEIFHHNRWANERLLVACRDLTPQQFATAVDGTYVELGSTLRHIVSAESWYLGLFTGWEPPVRWSRTDPFPGVEPLLERSRFTGDRMIAVAAETPPDRRIDVDGEPVPAAIVLLQVINHATEHRSQAATILTQLGIEPPGLSGWAHGESQGRAR